MSENQVEQSPRVFKVPVENVERLQSQIEVVNQRVQRLRKKGHDVELVEIKVGQPYVVKVRDPRDVAEVGPLAERLFVDVELMSPEPPRVDGWEFVAALTHVEGVGAVLRVVPGAQVADGELKRYREASPENCDHCHAQRKRTDTFVVRDRQGALSQVGRQCLKAYTGLASPERLCARAELLFSLSELLSDSEGDDFGGGFGSGQRYVTIERYLPYVACSIRQDGWLSRTAARERGGASQSTCDLACSHGVYAMPELPEKDRYYPTEKDFSLAAATIEHCEQYFVEKPVDDLTDYENSLRVAMASGIAHPKFLGLIASAVPFYQRDVERRARNDSWAKMVEGSRYQGVVGERGIFENLRVLAYRTWESNFGVTHFYSFVDEQSNAYAYFASRDLDLAVGQVVSFWAKVKKHELRTPKFDGAKSYQQTVITRASRVMRARVVSQDVVDLVVKSGGWNGEPPVTEKRHCYHFESSDGRKFALLLKSRKKALGVGVVAVVSYDEDSVNLPSGEKPVGLVSVVEQAQASLALVS